MNRSTRDALVRGAVGGLLAAVLVAAWFLVLDLATARAFRTPAELASVYLGRESVTIDPGVILGYTVLHFTAFAALGAVTAWILAALEIRPNVLVGLVFGLGVLNGLHYTGLLLTGRGAWDVLPTGHVIGANLAAGLLLMEYLRRAELGERFLGLGRIRSHPFLVRSLVTGIVGGGAVALWFFVLDLLAGEPFLTPAALGSALFLDADPGGVQVSFGIVALYSAVHLVAFLAAGAAFSWAADQIERRPGLWLLLLLSFIVLEAVFVPAAGLAGGWLLGALSWWAVGVGNLLAVASMGWWIWRSRPELRRQVREEARLAGGGGEG